MQDRKAEEADEAVIHVAVELKHIIPMFLEEMRGYVEAIRQALGKREFPAIRVLGHTISGTASYFGIDPIIGIGKSLESAAKEQNPETVRALANRVSNYLDRIQVMKA